MTHPPLRARRRQRFLTSAAHACGSGLGDSDRSVAMRDMERCVGLRSIAWGSSTRSRSICGGLRRSFSCGAANGAGSLGPAHAGPDVARALTLAVALNEKRRPRTSEPKRCADRDHRRASGVNGVDDLGGVDALQVDGSDAEVAVAELTLDDHERHAFARHLHGVGVAELVGREAAAHAGRGAAQLRAGGCGRPRSAPGGAVDDAEQRPDRKLEAKLEPGWSSCEPQSSMPTSRRRPPLPRRTSSEPRR
jgi:hypothetical protein